MEKTRACRGYRMPGLAGFVVSGTQTFHEPRFKEKRITGGMQRSAIPRLPPFSRVLQRTQEIKQILLLALRHLIEIPDDRIRL